MGVRWLRVDAIADQRPTTVVSQIQLSVVQSLSTDFLTELTAFRLKKQIKQTSINILMILC